MQSEIAREAAHLSGGRLLTLAGLSEFVGSLEPEKKLTNIVKTEKELWDTPLWFLLFVVFAGAEWYLRRKDNLV